MAMARYLIFIAACVLTAGCDSGGCTEGMSIGCVCPTGAMGAQVCEADGTYAECVCQGLDAGSRTDAGRDEDAGGGLDAAVDAGGADAGDDDAGEETDAGTDAGGSGSFAYRIASPEERIVIEDSPMGTLYNAEFTFELWIRFDRVTPTLPQQLMVADGGSPVIMQIRNDILECSVDIPFSFQGRARAQLTDASTQISAGVWHHFACVGDGADRVDLFVDGIRRATATGTSNYDFSPPGARLVFGGSPSDGIPGTSYQFAGEMDEIRVSTARLYTGAPFTPPRRFAVEADTAVLFHFDEGTGTTTADATGTHPGASMDQGGTWVAE